ncbi:MAG: TPM domain-containing protein [Deltaproteobacteria bacterium]|nr:TPM domain-containing protein [Deltaproteobacteria bacterium]
MESLPDWATRVLGADGHRQIEDAIERAESRTSGEIVPVLVRRSSTVGHVPILAFALLLLAALMLDLPVLLSSWGGGELLWVGACWLAAAALGFGLTRFDAVERLLTPRPDQMRQVDLRAQVEFYELGLSQTEARTGVLLLVSLMEHRAVVLADHGIAQKLDETIWQEVVDLMIEGVKSGDLARGMCEAIDRCGELLAVHFPIAEGDANELHDHLIVKD